MNEVGNGGLGGEKTLMKQMMLHNKAVMVHVIVVCGILITAQLV